MARDIQLDEPPRKVPVTAQLAVVLAGATTQSGSTLLLFTLAFAWLFGLQSEAITMVEFRGEQKLTTGAVIDVTETIASEDRSTIHEIRYTYAVDGVSYSGASYDLHGRYDRGQAVAVQYLVEDPQRSRIQGLRVRKFGAVAIFPIFLPLLGLAMVLRGMWDGLSARRLLKLGKLAFGTLVHKEATNVSVNKQTVYQLTFEFTVPEQQRRGGYRHSAKEESEVYQAVHRTHLTGQLGDGAEKPLLFDPQNPSRVYPIDGLPGEVTISAAGRVLGPPKLLNAVGLPLVGWTALLAFLVALFGG